MSEEVIETVEVDPDATYKEDLEATGAEIMERPLGQVSIYRSMNPKEQLAEAQERAAVLVQVIQAQGLAKTFGNSAKPHVFVEGWQFLASQFGLVPDIESTAELDNGWEARARLTRLSDGMVIAHADGECRTDEGNWKNRPSYAVRSMAQTRAVSKVCRIALSSVMVMAGYSATPAEEMTDLGRPIENVQRRQPMRVDNASETAGNAYNCPACLDKLGTIVPVTGPHDRKPFWRCTADPSDCGGLRVYNGKEYSWSGWRTSFENSVAEWRNDVIKNDPQTATVNGDERRQRNDYIIEGIMGIGGITNTVDATALIKPGLVFAIEEGSVDARAALGGEPADPITDDELKVIVVNLTLAEADFVIAAAVEVGAPFEKEMTDEEAEARAEMRIQEGE